MEEKLNLFKECVFIRCKSVYFFNIILRILLILDVFLYVREVVNMLNEDVFM